jgi:hypothetical protein
VEVFECEFASKNVPTEFSGPAGIPFVSCVLESAVFDQAGGGQQRSSDRVHPADVSVEEINRIHALSAQLRVEIEAPCRQAAAAQDLVQRQRHLLHAVRELIGIPAVLGVAPIRVDAPEHAVRHREREFVLEAVPGQCRVVDFDVDLDFVFEIEFLQEGDIYRVEELLSIRPVLLK